LDASLTNRSLFLGVMQPFFAFAPLIRWLKQTRGFFLIYISALFGLHKRLLAEA
jgi:hypothetical protein